MNRQLIIAAILLALFTQLPVLIVSTTSEEVTNSTESVKEAPKGPIYGPSTSNVIGVSVAAAVGPDWTQIVILLSGTWGSAYSVAKAIVKALRWLAWKRKYGKPRTPVVANPRFLAYLVSVLDTTKTTMPSGPMLSISNMPRQRPDDDNLSIQKLVKRGLF